MMMNSSKTLLFLTLLFSFQHLMLVHSHEFQVGEKKGWVLPSSKNTQIYNVWASKQRFIVGDTIRFNYEKDSVVVVNKTEYEKCHSVRPIFFSNNGDTVLKLEQPGLFYFISGVAGHCQRGQKMIVKVLDPNSWSPPSSGSGHNHTGMTTPDLPEQSDAASKDGIVFLTVVFFVVSFFV